MSKINDGGPAFPAKVSVNRESGELQPHQFGNDDFCTVGLSLRDYFAAKAMQARLSDYESCKSLIVDSTKHGISMAENVAMQAYDMADAMLAARGET